MGVCYWEGELEVKAISGDGSFVGYGSVFGVRDHHREIVAPGAFAKSLKKWAARGGLPAMLWMHDPTQPIGVWAEMKEDGNGLRVEGKLALRTTKGAEAYELLKMGAVSGLSIGYRVVASKVDAARKARILTEVDLFEVSLVTFPANEEARVERVKAPTRSVLRLKPEAVSVERRVSIEADIMRMRMQDKGNKPAARLYQVAGFLVGRKKANDRVLRRRMVSWR